MLLRFAEECKSQSLVGIVEIVPLLCLKFVANYPLDVVMERAYSNVTSRQQASSKRLNPMTLDPHRDKQSLEKIITQIE